MPHTGKCYDVQNLTIRHVKCTWKIPVSDAQTKCQTCKTYRDNVLRSGLSRQLKQKEDEERSSKVCAVDSHVNYRYLTTPEKLLRMCNLHTMVRLHQKKIYQLHSQLEKIIQSHGVSVDDNLNGDLMAVAQKHQPNTTAGDETFSSIFWKQQVKASSVKSSKGMRWHPAMIRWCLYLLHKSSGCYKTLRATGVLHLPSE